MSLPTSLDLRTLDFALDAQPFVVIAGSYGTSPGLGGEWVLDAQPVLVAYDPLFGLSGGCFLTAGN